MDEETKTEDVKAPSKELKETTSQLVSEALANAKDCNQPWYKRGLFYAGAATMVIVYMVAELYGAEFLNKLIEALKVFLGS